MGVGRYLRSRDPRIRVYPAEPAESPTLSTGHKVGKHRIQGVSDEFIPPILDLAVMDKVVAVPDGDAIIMAQKLASQLGLGVGISSGCNFLAALKVQEQLGPGCRRQQEVLEQRLAVGRTRPGRLSSTAYKPSGALSDRSGLFLL